MTPARKEPDGSTYAGRFAIRLKKLREEAKLSVPALVEKTGIPRTTIYNWESGIRTPPFDTLPKLAEALGVTVRELMPET